MAADLNSVTLVGRLTRDAEARQTAGGTSVMNMRLAFSTRVKRNDSWQDESNYVDVVVFGKEGLGQYLTKGSRIGVVGRLQYREWESDKGKRSTLEVVANDVQLLDGKPQGGGGRAPVDDDLPF